MRVRFPFMLMAIGLAALPAASSRAQSDASAPQPARAARKRKTR